jgi:hypothetical protein
VSKFEIVIVIASMLVIFVYRVIAEHDRIQQHAKDMRQYDANEFRGRED